MQSLGDVLSKKGDHFDDPDFAEYDIDSHNSRKPIAESRRGRPSGAINDIELEAIQEDPSANRAGERKFQADQDFSLKSSSIRNIRDQRAGNISNTFSMSIKSGSMSGHILTMQSEQLKEHFEKVDRHRQATKKQ